MTEDKFQQMIKEKALTEFRFGVNLIIRCGGDTPGGVSNAVEAELTSLLPRNGMMVDRIDVEWPLEEGKR